MNAKLKVGLIQKSLSYIAEEMGITLRNSSSSPNIRERLDFSCAITDESGRVIAEAEHIPVHLGSMAWAAKKLIELYRDFADPSNGDVMITNDPYITGTHLNDVTLWTHCNGFYLIVKAHYVDIGGPKAGSLNAFARYLDEEGMVIKPMKIASKWQLDENAVAELSRNTRNPRLFRADLNAQLSSLKRGCKQLEKLSSKYSISILKSYVNEYIEASRKAYVRSLERYVGKSGSSEVPLELPDSEVAYIRLRLSVNEDSILFDFSETDDEIDYNLNAVEGIAYSAASFFVKSFLSKNGDVNQGLYDVIKVRTRKGSILNPNYPRAVGAGNLETSQRTLQSVILAFSQITHEVPSLGPGTMSNVIISYRDRVYYETNGGGGSATPYDDGENGVQWGMTNTLNTPIEVLESELPILIREYKIRRGSGGRGKRKGGDGIIRTFEALDEVGFSILLSQTRVGSSGILAEDGKAGRIEVCRSSEGCRDVESGYLELTLRRGDRIRIETPGAGGHG